ncbi:MAG: PAS domain S-box protein [Chloroflexi bacterium]|nr:PAS domain S-box protein [Chloroflexota bacterium]MDA1173622.1 PAS domain S-box protein [Chloroflexota bacterium]
MASDSINLLLICKETDAQPLRDVIDIAEHPWPVHTETVTTLAAAFGRLGVGDVDLALLDLALPGSAGVATLVQARAMAPSTAFVVVVEHDHDEIGDESVLAGAQDILLKGTMDPVIVARTLRHAMERQQADSALHQSEARYRTLFHDSQEAIFISDQSGQVSDINETALEMFALAREDACGHDLGQWFVDPMDRHRFREALIAGNGRTSGFEVWLRRGDGSPIRVVITANRRFETGGTPGGVQGYIRDITESRQAEEALRESETRFRALAQSARYAIISADTEGLIVFWNDAAKGTFGYDQSEVIGKSLTMLMPERYRDAHQAGLERYRDTGVPHVIGQTLELAGIRKDDQEFPLELSVAAWNTGSGSFVSAIIRDITERVEAEKARREAEVLLRQRDKMAQLGTLSAGMAHELNNPAAAVIRGSGQLEASLMQMEHAQALLGEIALAPEQEVILKSLSARAHASGGTRTELEPLQRADREIELCDWLDGKHPDAFTVAPALVELNYDVASLDELATTFSGEQLPVVLSWLSATYTAYAFAHEIGHGATRISDMVDTLKSYSYLDRANLLEVDVHEALESTLAILAHKLRPGISVHRDYSPDVPGIQAYGSELNQVWTALIDNAADALQGKGDITFRPHASPEEVTVTIEDNGPGIPADVQPRVFDAFFTTKPTGHGTGVGLTVIYNVVVERHRGDLAFETEPGKTAFTVTLPTNLDVKD